MQIRQDDLTNPATVRFLAAHLDNMHEITPPESVHALAVDQLRAEDITLFTAWDGDHLVGCGALRALDPTRGEIKAMRTDEARRGRGIGSKILEHLILVARRRGYGWLYLETGAMPEFAPARALYTRYGFHPHGPFGDYVDDPNSIFMAKALRDACD